MPTLRSHSEVQILAPSIRRALAGASLSLTLGACVAPALLAQAAHNNNGDRSGFAPNGLTTGMKGKREGEGGASGSAASDTAAHRGHRSAMPAMGAMSPSAFGAATGDIFVTVSYQARDRYTQLSDGAVAAGFGLGDPVSFAAIEVDVVSLSSVRQGFGHIGGVDVMLHRQLPGNLAIGVGWEGAALWGPGDGSSSPFATLSGWFHISDDAASPLNAIVLTAGTGGGRFLRESDQRADRKTANVFGSVALQVFTHASLVADWSGQDLLLGVSIAPIPQVPIAFSAGFADVTGTAGDGARLLLGAVCAVSLRHSR